ncbi:MAG: fluoride efflux transporter CrcB [Bdellovibrionales bacterium]
MSSYIFIAIGSALGGIARFWCAEWAATSFDDTFPWGTMLVNIIGSFLIGFFATLTGPDGRVLVRQEHRQFVMIGLCGGFTTFSSFSLQTLTLAQSGNWAHAGANVVLSVSLCLFSVWLGHMVAAALNQLKGA